MDANKLKGQAKELTGSLRELGTKKEQKYKEKTKLDGVLNKLIKEAIDLKTRKKEIEKELASLKSERNKKNKGVREGLTKLKQLKAQHQKNKKRVPKISKSKILAEIQQLEFQIETSAFSIAKEKGIMTKIKSLKKTINEYEASNAPPVEFKRIQSETKEIKRSADKIHDKIQEFAKESSQIFERLTELSSEITKIKREKNVAKLVLNGLKDQINVLNAKLGGVLRDMSKLPASATKSALDIFGRGNKRNEINIKEALKKGKKLSKDDILKLQKGLMKK
jgi:uncharacterized coiled-coil DUF342 family protein|tara:strand:- start:162 stop:998 length:837 start_codon:yes stop_codon:yes gene_type:complete